MESMATTKSACAPMAAVRKSKRVSRCMVRAQAEGREGVAPALPAFARRHTLETLEDRHKNPRKTPTQSRGIATVESLVEATRRLIQKDRGTEKLTVAQIARTAGVSVASVYQFFPTKEALIAACMEAELARAAQAFTVEALAMHEARVSLDEAVPRLTILSMKMIRQLFRAMPLPKDAPRQSVREMLYARSAELLSTLLLVRAEDDARVRGKDITTIARVVARAVTDLGECAVDDDDPTFEAFSRETARMIARYILTPDAAGGP